MRILLCNWKDTTHPRAGGAELYTHEVLRRWAASGHAVTQLGAAVDGRPERETLDGIDLVRRGGRLGVYREARRFLLDRGESAFDVVIDEINTRPFGLARYVRHTPVVALAHQVARDLWFSELPLPAAALGRFVLEPHWLRAYREVPVLTISASSRDSLRAYGLRRVSVVPVGIDVPLRTVPARKADEPTIVFVGRLTAGKRVEHAVEAIRLLRESIPAARLAVVGTGPLERSLRREAGPGVTFYGHVSDEEKLELVARAHALVVTSVREGWGLVVDEAAAVGTPAIGYDVPGLRDSIPAAGGILVPPAPAALAQRLAEVLPTWQREGPRPGWRGGALSWDEVADAVLAEVEAAVEAPREAAVAHAAVAA